MSIAAQPARVDIATHLPGGSRGEPAPVILYCPTTSKNISVLMN